MNLHILQCDYYKELEVEKKKLDDIHIKLRNQIETLNDRIAKLECINSDTLSDYQVLSNENIVLKKVFFTFFCYNICII